MAGVWMRPATIMFVIGITVAGCARTAGTDSDADGGDTPRASRPADSGDVAIERFPDSVYSYIRYGSGYDDRARLVVRDQETWRQVWQQMHERHGTKPAPPVVDFTSRMLLVATAGTRPTGGYSILIDEYRVGSEGATARVTTTSPGRTCGTTAALTHPADVVIVPQTERPVSWLDASAVHECGP